MKDEEWADDLQDGLTDEELDELEPTAAGDGAVAAHSADHYIQNL